MLKSGLFKPMICGHLKSRLTLVDENGEVTLARDYQPYGETLSSSGAGMSVYGFTGEAADPSGLIFLRARYYAPSTGRFLSRDPWEGDVSMPMSYNAWLYGYANPVVYRDPSGYLPLTIVSDDTGSWNYEEERAIESAALDVGRKLARVINETYLKQWRMHRCSFEYRLPFYKRVRVNPTTAFLEVYGGPVTFNHVDYGSPERAWGRSISAREIRLYETARVVGNPRFIVHELGHSFENALAEILGPDKDGKEQKPLRATLERIQFLDPTFPDRAPVNMECVREEEDENGKISCVEWDFDMRNENYGFAGLYSVNMINAWQQTVETTSGEEFADMYIGWVYDQWHTDPETQRLSAAGYARANFMDMYMPRWVWLTYTK